MTEHLLTLEPDTEYLAKVNARRALDGRRPYTAEELGEEFKRSITCLHPELCTGWIECSQEHPNSDPEDDESPVCNQYEDVMMHGVAHDMHGGMWTVPYVGCVVQGADWETPDDLYPLRAGTWIVQDDWDDTCVYLEVVREVVHLCPECAQGKTGNCIGETLNAADEWVPCATTNGEPNA